MKKSKLIKSLSLGIISLGLLTGVGISFSNNIHDIHADDVSGEISDKYLEPASQIESDSDKTEAGEIYTGIQQCKKYPQIAASAAAGSGKYIFQQYKNQILPYYDKAQMKEFIYDYDNNEINDGTTIDSKGNIHKIKATHHANKTKANKKNKLSKKLHKSHKYVRKNRKHAKKSTRRAKLSKKQFNKLNKQLKADKKALKSRRAKHNYKYRKALIRTIKKINKQLKSARR